MVYWLGQLIGLKVLDLGGAGVIPCHHGYAYLVLSSVVLRGMRYLLLERR